MNISRNDLSQAAGKGIITQAQADELWASMQKRSEVTAQFDLSHVAYYLGAMIVIAAMAWLMTNGGEKYGGLFVAVLAVVYAVCFVLVGWYLWNNLKLNVAGGLLYTLAVWMTPVAIYGVQRWCGLWPGGIAASHPGSYQWNNGNWLVMEFGTIVMGLIALRSIRFPFLTMPVALALWFMSMDITQLVYGQAELVYHDKLWVSTLFGLVMLVVTYLVDRRTKEDFAFWGYLFGLLAFWGALSLMESTNEWGKLAYCLINLALIAISLFINRRVFIIFGALGFFGYLGHLAHDLFKDSMLFPLALSLVGIAVIFLGVKYQRHKDAIHARASALIPPNLKWLVPEERMRG